VREAAEAALGRARPLAHNGYKIDLTRALVSRALMALVADLA
jgi:CO/xanthine dehydrogenase FAD-binding subunit